MANKSEIFFKNQTSSIFSASSSLCFFYNRRTKRAYMISYEPELWTNAGNVTLCACVWARERWKQMQKPKYYYLTKSQQQNRALTTSVDPQ